MNRRKIYKSGMCWTHYTAVTSSRSTARKDKHVLDNFRLSPELYAAILKAQGGVCYICHKKPGRNRRLSVDHDHKIAKEQCDHPVKQGCPRCIRGLLHSKCNSYLGWVRDDVEAFERGKQYLLNPPARLVFLARGLI